MMTLFLMLGLGNESRNMKRRKFITDAAWLGAGLLVAGNLPASAISSSRKIRGRVLVNGKGIRSVVISDGYSVVATDNQGKYELEAHPAASVVFISTPAGYEFLHEKGVARHYKYIDNIRRKKDGDFDLTPLTRNDNEHGFVIWADPQVKNASDVEKMMTQSVPSVQKIVAAAGPGSLLHGITVGDIVWDELQLFSEYSKAVEKTGIPFFQCIGNHDMDYNKGGDESSDDTFQKMYGPTYYSFNRGKAHYIIMDDVRYLGKDREYDGYISAQQLDWLQKDLAFVPKEHLVILCVHIPIHNGIKNNTELYPLLNGRKVHIMSGHTHYHRNVITGNIYEHNHGTVCGAWWTGSICGDGTPCGYGVYRVNGNELQWHYQATGEPADHQMKIFVEPKTNSQKEILVNIWNHDPAWKTEYIVDGISQGSLEQFEGFDPVAYKTLLGPDLPKPRGFAEPRKTEHIFKAFIPPESNEIKIVATDPFGKTYVETIKG